MKKNFKSTALPALIALIVMDVLTALVAEDLVVMVAWAVTPVRIAPLTVMIVLEDAELVMANVTVAKHVCKM